MSPTTRKPRRSSAPAMPMWRVTITAHDVPPRWHVPASIVEMGSPTADLARYFAVQRAHIDADVPAMRSLLALSLRHARADKIERRS